ncbi:C39 family peptidase [Deinococcus multiflagellatus]|uniref:C39 family peptidase n=1 Tax=Deinococcus multiflagellatus TaxID=1656887 RepID=A0ABW1ZSB9_9DEIO
MTRRWWLILGAGWSWGVASAQPASVTLTNIRHDFQALNNCAPVTAMTLLGYYGASVTQAQAAAVMKDYPGDPQVTSLELASYLGRAGLQSVIRYAGDAELLRSLVAAGFPVVLQQRLQRGSNVAHFRTVYGYSAGQFLISDPLLGPSLRLSAQRLAELWAYYNGEYLVAFPPQGLGRCSAFWAAITARPRTGSTSGHMGSRMSKRARVTRTPGGGWPRPPCAWAMPRWRRTTSSGP